MHDGPGLSVLWVSWRKVAEVPRDDVDVYVRHGVAEDLVVEVTGAEHRLDGSRCYGYG